MDMDKDKVRHQTGNHGCSVFSLLRRLTDKVSGGRFLIILPAFATLLAAPAQAGQWSLLLNGKAVHLEQRAGAHYNEENWGAGVQYDFNMTKGKWVPFVSASGFKDSNGNPSYYAGGGTMRRFFSGVEKNSMHLDVGVVAFLMTRKDYNGGQPFPGALPVLSFGTDRVALNVTYIPKVDPKLVPILFFQLKVGMF